MGRTTIGDLGLYQFESYSIDQEHRPYRTTFEIQQHWLLYQLEALFQLADVSDPARLQEISDEQERRDQMSLLPDDTK